MQKLFYRFMQQQEELRVQQEQLKVNKAFYFTIENMFYSLNGMPLHEIKMATKPNIEFNEKQYSAKLKTRKLTALLSTVKNECSVVELRQNTLQVKELLRRVKKSPVDKVRKKAAKPINKSFIDTSVQIKNFKL